MGSSFPPNLTLLSDTLVLKKNNLAQPLFRNYNSVLVPPSEPPVTVIVILAGLGGDLVLGHSQAAHHVYLHHASDTLGELTNNVTVTVLHFQCTINIFKCLEH